jgi:hypothetical protein
MLHLPAVGVDLLEDSPRESLRDGLPDFPMLFGQSGLLDPEPFITSTTIGKERSDQGHSDRTEGYWDGSFIQLRDKVIDVCAGRSEGLVDWLQVKNLRHRDVRLSCASGKGQKRSKRNEEKAGGSMAL